MKKTKIPTLLSAFLLASCANVTFHPEAPNEKTADLSRQTGLKYYTAKPYLLIGPTGNKDAPMKAEIISLPDLEHPTYAIYHPGWGSHNFSLAVSSAGILSSYGQTVDSKGPETIAALSGLISSAATMTSAVKAPAAATVAAGAPSSLKNATANLTGESPALSLVKAAIEDLSDIKKISEQSVLVESNKRTAATLIDHLQTWLNPKSPLEQPDPEAGLLEIAGEIKSALIPDPSHVDAAVTINSCYDKAKKHVDAAINSIRAGKPPKQDFKLFEIKMEAGITRLIPADVRLASAVIKQWEYAK